MTTMMLPGSAHIAESIRRGRLVSQTSLDKSSSDGESDSGFSSNNDERREFPPEVEYSWECPTEASSMLFDLMTESPQKNAGRDVLDLSSDARSPVNEGRNEKLRRTNQYESECKNGVLQEHMQHKVKCQLTKDGLHYLPSSYAARYSDVKQSQYNFENDEDYNLVYRSPGLEPNSHLTRNSTVLSPDVAIAADTLMHLHSSSSSNTKSLTTSSLLCTESLSSSQHIMHANPQRKICFDEYVPPQLVSLRDIPDTHSNNYEEPIDYSQLSSRPKKADDSNKESNLLGDDTKNNGKYYEKYHPHTLRTESEEKIEIDQNTTQKVSFILSPQLSPDGKIVLSENQPPIQPTPTYVSYYNYQPKLFSQSASYPQRKDNSNQSSPLSETVAPPVDYSCENTSSFSQDRKSHFNNLQDEDTESLYKKMAYHPKLKYLLASSKKNGTMIKSESPKTEDIKSPKEPKIYESNLSPSTSPDYARIIKEDQEDHPPVIPPYSPVPSFSSPIFSPTSHPSYHNNVSKGSSTLQNHLLFPPQIYSRSPTQPISSMFDRFNPISQSSAHEITSISSNRSSSSINFINASSLFKNQDIQSSNSSSPSTSPPSPYLSSTRPTPNKDQSSPLTDLLFNSSASSKHNIDPYACDDCGKRYSTSSNLARHRQTHRSICDKKARKCPHCEKVYVSMPAYSMHVRTHNQGCECSHCGKKFSRPWLLQGHIRTHTGEKPFACAQCGKSFADKSNLRAHIQTHSTDKPYSCGRCGKAFALKSYLYKHEESSCMRGQRFRRC